MTSTNKHKKISTKLLFTGILFLLFFTSFYLGKYINAYKPPQQEKPKNAKETAVSLKKVCSNYEKLKFRSSYDCYSDAFYKMTQSSGSDFALNAVDELKKIDIEVKSSCHPLGHAIGWGIYDLDPGKWKDEIRRMPTDCTYGIHMGMIERFASLNGGKFDKETVKTICDDSGGCNHGIGHVSLVVTDNNISEALDLCSVLPNSLEQRHWCYTGVFMEKRTMQNLSEHIPVKKERLDNWAYLLDDYMNECVNYKDEVYIACWSGLALPASIKFPTDSDKIFEICNSAVVHMAANKCRREAVNYIVEFNADDIHAQSYLCKMGPEYDLEFAQDCHNQIVSNGIHILEPENIDTMVDYCNNITDIYRKGCFKYIHYGLSELRKPIDDETVCKKALPAYKDICLGYNEA